MRERSDWQKTSGQTGSAKEGALEGGFGGSCKESPKEYEGGFRSSGGQTESSTTIGPRVCEGLWRLATRWPSVYGFWRDETLRWEGSRSDWCKYNGQTGLRSDTPWREVLQREAPVCGVS
ncbi:hypothetical protein GUJ93_ZPchr0012g21444 [Zizania palustris]|uniref:Uncharacterized protein n=1 Tax=Zizania palustris TaxID=103762 RepID=A0A8J5WR99_ZIZPA|nr:hypothetical protein GUJ93_ZPchr0012g21444 [Zizania palustris]